MVVNTAGSDYPLLLPEIWGEILARLPVRSVLRCRSVCKSWYSLISCPNFISHYSITNLEKKNGNRLLLHHYNSIHCNWSFSSHDMDMESDEHDDDYSPDPLNSPYLEFVGSCNGLICLCAYAHYASHERISSTYLLIWNPAIRKLVELPPLTHWYFSKRPSYVGFGYDSNTSDYKVLCNLGHVDSEDNDCKIFDVSKGVWRSISPLVPSHHIGRPEAECYANGALHWSASKGIGRVILSFNMSDESFREIRMPGCAEFTQSGDDDRVKTQCVMFGGLVHVILWKIKPGDYYADSSEGCSIWAMKEYGVAESWIKVSNIDLPSAQGLPSIHLCPENFFLRSKHEIFMVRYPPLGEDGDFLYERHLVLYNTASRKSKRITSATKCIEGFCQYKESLALM